MKKRFFLFFSMFLMLAVSSCKKVNEENSSNYYSSIDGISILNEDVLGYIDHIESDTIIVFSGSIPDDAIPKANTNIYVPVSDITPYGMIVKVISVDERGYVYVTTSPLSLDEVFEYLSLDDSFTYTTELEGVYDSLWNPIDFEIVDTANIDLNDTIGGKTIRNTVNTNGHFDWEHAVKIPVNIYKENKIKITGAAYVGFHKMNFDIDISNHKLRYLCFDATPYVKVGVNTTFKAASATPYNISKRLGTLRYRLTIPTPAGIPIIIPITLSVNGVFGVSGEISATLGLQYEYNCNCVLSYKNGQWNSQANHENFQNKSPWTPVSFDVSGQIHGGFQFGLLAGLYSSTVGIGFHVSPDLSIKATAANLSLPNLLFTKPKVDLKFKIGSDVYCIARIFGLNLGKYTMEFGDYTLWKKTMPLLPDIQNFDAYGNGSSADISWMHNKDYFLYMFGHGVKTGTTVFESDASTEVSTYKPSPSNSNETTNFYNVNATGLHSGRTYYAAPLAYWGPFHWHGEKVEFTTEGSYHLDFRCADQSYDVISFDFNLNNNTGNVIDYTTEATDYNGGHLRAHITATYDASNQTLDGIFDWYSYENPGQERIDGFSVSLATNDSGYVNCYKIVDNGGCDAALRIYLNGSKASQKKYTTPLSNDNCNIGIYNKNYKK